MRFLIVSVFAFFSLFVHAAGEAPVAEQVEVNLVLVDATVTDRSGNQILGLEIDDFIVREDGEIRQIASLDYFTNRRLLTEKEDQAAFKVERVREERYFVLFFHKLLGPPSHVNFNAQLIRAREGAISFIENDLLPEDKVAVVGLDSRLKIFADFTSDKDVLRKALHDAAKYSNGITEVPAYASPDLSILRQIDTRRMLNRTSGTTDSITLLAEALPSVAARTVMVLFTPIIANLNSSGPTYTGFIDEKFESMIRTLNRKNVSVNVVNLLGSVGTESEAHRLALLADRTGGAYYRSPRGFAAPLREIENANNGYYMISYYADPPAGKSGYQKIDVELRNPEFRLKAREGYGWGEE